MNPLQFLIPGALDRPTGGSRYDRFVIEGLRGLGMTVEVSELAGRYPAGDPVAQASLTACLDALPNGATVVVDGLVFGALPRVFALHAERLALINLLHHPLADETGLTAAEQQHWLASESQAMQLAAGVIATSAFSAERLAQLGLYHGPVHVAAPGVEIKTIAAGNHTSPIVQLLCVGSLIPRKGHSELLDALASIADLPWHCLLAGSTTLDPSHADAVAQHCDRLGLRERVTITGALSDDALEAAFASADIFVLPSYYEGYGMVITEAIAHGLPVITTRGGALATTLPEGAGVAVAVGDTKALATALRQGIGDEETRSEWRQGAIAARAGLSDWMQTSREFYQALEIITAYA